jgi:hypothetical protein
VLEKKNLLIPVYLLILTLLCFPCLAQQKYEREYGIKQNNVPQRALEFISSAFKKTKIHWYGEESLTGKSIEAKFKDSGKRYSIEFDEAGKIQDIEILSSISRMEEKNRTRLEENLGKKFSKYKVIKTQLQWSGTESDLRQALLKDKLPSAVVTRYELVLRATRNKKEAYFEVLCENNGAIVSVSEIIQRNADNLIY